MARIRKRLFDLLARTSGTAAHRPHLHPPQCQRHDRESILPTPYGPRPYRRS